MKHPAWAAFLAASLLIAPQVLAGGDPARGAPDKAVPFTLTDQYDKSYTLKPPVAKPVLLIFLNKHDSVAGQARKWRVALNGVSDRAEIRQIVPINTTFGPTKLFIKAHMKEDPSYLLDWGCKVAREYGFSPESKAARLVLFGKDGRRLTLVEGAFTAAAHEAILSNLGPSEPKPPVVGATEG